MAGKAKPGDPFFLACRPAQGERHLRTNYPGALLVGIDEAGRGPLAGPVVAAAVVLAGADSIPGLNDSKKLSEAKREALFPLIQERALAWAIAEASPAEIDRHNILQADFLAMRRALSALGWPGLEVGESKVWSRGPSCLDTGLVLAVVDGNQRIAGVDFARQLTVVKGDGHVASIAAASILAKVHRDRVMVELDVKYPQYGFAGHKGYPSEAHIEAIRTHGLCPEHRKSFKPKALAQTELFK